MIRTRFALHRIAVWVFALPLLFCATAAQAELTCARAAHAYACCDVGAISTFEFLNSCVQTELTTVTGSGKPLPKNPTAVNPLVCHRDAAGFAANAGSLTTSALMYLDVCLDRDIHYYRAATAGSGARAKGSTGDNRLPHRRQLTLIAVRRVSHCRMGLSQSR